MSIYGQKYEGITTVPKNVLVLPFRHYVHKPTLVRSYQSLSKNSCRGNAPHWQCKKKMETDNYGVKWKYSVNTQPETNPIKFPLSKRPTRTTMQATHILGMAVPINLQPLFSQNSFSGHPFSYRCQYPRISSTSVSGLASSRSALEPGGDLD